ncbi:MAG: DUF4139 domain-containing protein [Myxococcaceae bacterium]
MKSLTLLLIFVFLAGCGARTSSYVRSDGATLGRVVIYRNGVAYFERTARVEGDHLDLKVPADKIDDFLKSLTVVDAQTGQPAPISYPTRKDPGAEDGLVEMRIGLSGPSPHQLKLSYVTDAASWKPSYRVVLGPGGKVELEAWAIVDNTSGEDWNNVRLGVGSSSALSFRYDLKSVRLVEREMLQQHELFAYAPPIGGATWGEEKKLVAEFDEKALDVAGDPSVSGPASPRDEIALLAKNVQSSPGPVTIEGFATSADSDKQQASLQRANRLREQLVRKGVDPRKLVAVGRGDQVGHPGGVRVVESPTTQARPGVEDNKNRRPDGSVPPADPIGTSNFESGHVMSVAKSSSAMVSVLRERTEGEVVYLFDPESTRGNAQFPFKSVRFRNPSDSSLETGPVTVFGDGRFIGEGMAESIPARSVAFVPFALDRQIVVTRGTEAREEIAEVLSVQRGVFSAELQRKRKTTYTLNNRLGDKAVVYVRHTVGSGYKISKVPEGSGEEKLGAAHLFRVVVPSQGKIDVEIEETTPVYKTIDVRSPEGIEQVRVYISRSAADGPLKQQLASLLELNKQMADQEQRIATLREQMGEYRVRMDELHAQIVTLKAVKSAGPLMKSLEKKMQEVSDRLSRATIDVVGAQESLMVARIQFQDAVADLSLEKKS